MPLEKKELTITDPVESRRTALENIRRAEYELDKYLSQIVSADDIEARKSIAKAINEIRISLRSWITFLRGVENGMAYTKGLYPDDDRYKEYYI